LDENISREPLEKCINYFQTLYDVHLAQEKVDCTTLMADQVRVLLSACDCLGLDSTCLKLALLPGQEVSDVSILLKDLDSQSNAIRLSCRKIKRRIPQQDGIVTTAPLSFRKEVQDDLVHCIDEMRKVVPFCIPPLVQQ
jgi:dynactin 1